MTVEINNTKPKTSLEHFMEKKPCKVKKSYLETTYEINHFLLMVCQIWSNKAHKSVIKDILMVVLSFPINTGIWKIWNKQTNHNQQIKIVCGQAELKRKRKPYMVFFET